MAIVDPFTATWLAIERQLRLVFPKEGPSEVWQIELVPDPMTRDEFISIANRCPFIGVSWRQVTPDQGNGRNFAGRLGFRVTIVVKNSRGRQFRFLGDARGAGLFSAATAAVYVLQGAQVENVGALNVAAWAQAYAEGFNDQSAAIATLDVDVHTSLKDALGEADALPALQQIFSTILANDLDDGIDQDPINLPQT